MHTTTHVKTTSCKARGRECNPQLFVIESRGGAGRSSVRVCAFECVCVCVSLCWEGDDFTLIVCVCGGAGGISKSYVDFMTVCACVCQQEFIFMHGYPNA